MRKNEISRKEKLILLEGRLKQWQHFRKEVMHRFDKNPNEKLHGRELIEWILEADSHIRTAKDAIRLEKSKERKVALPLVVTLFVLALLFLTPLKQYVGFAVNENSTEYFEELGITHNVSSQYYWTPEHIGKLTTFRISGEIVGSGTAKAYLSNGNVTLKIIDSNSISTDEILTSLLSVEGRINISVSSGDGITTVLEYHNDTIFDLDNNGIESGIGVVDFTVKNSNITNANNLNSEVCTRWEIYSAERETSAYECYGDSNCCSLMGLQPGSENWNDTYYVFSEKNGASSNNKVRAQIVVFAENISVSDWSELDCNFIDMTKKKFTSYCEETCEMQLNSRHYFIITEVENASIIIENATYGIENATKMNLTLSSGKKIKDEKKIKVDTKVKEKIKNSGKARVIIKNPQSKITLTQLANYAINGTNVSSTIIVDDKQLIAIKNKINDGTLTAKDRNELRKSIKALNVAGNENKVADDVLYIISNANILTAKQSSRDTISVEIDETKLAELENNNLASNIVIDEPVSLLIQDAINLTGIGKVKEFNYTGVGTSICLVDSGINYALFNLTLNETVFGKNVITESYDPLDDLGHGTSVAKALLDVAPNAKIYAAKVIDSNGVGYESDVLLGLQYCEDMNTSIISMSIGSGEYSGYCDDNLVAQKVDEIANKGILVVASSGNDGRGTVKAPACARNALQIGVSTKDFMLANFSSYNNATILLAPGVNITTINNNGEAIKVTGSSMSAPFVSAAAALLIEADSNFKSMNTTLKKELLVHTGDIINETLTGRLFVQVNAYNAMINNITNNLSAEGIINDTSGIVSDIYGTLAITCDQGDTSTECNVTTAKTLDGYQSFNTLRIKSTGSITHSANTNAFTNFMNISATNLIIETGGRIDASGKGYSADNGPGKGLGHADGNFAGSGGAYGGNGGDGGQPYWGSASIGGTSYGNATNVTNFGSGGGTQTYSGGGTGGAGGGFVAITVSGTLTVDGGINSNGANGTYGQYGSAGGGGGAGGGIRVTAGTLAGSGNITAIGGNGGSGGVNKVGGGGGGGRIMVSYSSKTFSGTISAANGTSEVAYGTANNQGTNGPNGGEGGQSGTINETVSGGGSGPNVKFVTFNGSTTNFSAYNASQITNISNATLERVLYGIIRWNRNVNATDADFDTNVNIGNNFVYVNSTGLHSSFNNSANLTLYNVKYKSPIVLKDGLVCTNCVRLDWSNGNLTFNVSGFSNYTTVENSTINVWNNNKNNNILYDANNTKYVTQMWYYYVNYTNSSSGLSIANGNCTARFNDSTTFQMNYSSALGLYIGNRTIMTAGNYTFNVTCNASDYVTSIGYDYVWITQLSSSIASVVNSSRIIPTVAYKNSTLLGYCNATDSDSPLLYYNYKWYLNNSLNVSGTTSTSYAQSSETYIANLTSGNFTKGQNWIFSCQGNDTLNSSLWLNSSPVTILNTAPMPASSKIAPTTIMVNGTMLGYCNATDIDSDNVYYNYQWYLNGALNRSGSSGSTNYAQSVESYITNLTSGNLSIGQIWIFSCQANDTTNVSSWINSSQVNIITNYVNSAVVINSSRIIPTVAYANNTLLGYCNATDNDTSLIYYNYAWYLNGALNRSGSSGSTNYAQSIESYITNLTSGNLTRWQNWTFSCQANDTINVSSWINSSIVIINNSLAVVVARVDPTPAYVNSTLIGYCNATDIDNDTICYYWTWYENGAINKTNTSCISGTPSTSYAYQENANATTFEGSWFSGTETSTVDGDWGTSGFSVTGQGIGYVNYTKPSGAVNTSKWRVKDQLAEVQLSLTPDCWSQNPLKFKFIADYSGLYLYWYCWDGATWYNLRTSSYGYYVINEEAMNWTISSGGETTRIEQGLEINVENISSSSLTIGDNWVLSCMANDNLGNGSYYNSSVKTILSNVTSNSAPIINSSRISPTTAYVNNTLLGYCNATDIDNDNVYYNYRWYLNGALNRSGNSASSFAQSVESYITNLTSGNLSIGQMWAFSCQANDTQNVSSWVNSSQVIILNMVPIINSSRISPITAYVNDTLVGYCNATDFEGENLTYYYKWFLNNVLNISGVSTQNYTQGFDINVANISFSNLTKGQNWIFSCLANDTMNVSSWINSSQVTILNSEPRINSSRIAPTIAYVNNTLLGYCNATDIDNDNVYYNYQWYLNGALNRSGSSGSTNYAQSVESYIINLTSGNLSIGQMWAFSCQANDTQNVSSWVNSSQVIILTNVTNNVPIINSSRISPTTAYVNNTLLGYCNATDIDADNLYYNYRWYLNGALNRSGNSASSFAQSVESYITNLTSGNLTKGQNWIFSCLANDTMNVSSWINSSQVTILNSEPRINSSRIAPTIAYVNDTLYGYCNASDIDGTNLIYYYKWYKNNVSYSSNNERVAVYPESISCEGVFNVSYPCANGYDGNWNTKIVTGEEIGGDSSIYMNFTKPQNISSVLWKVKDNENVTLPTIRDIVISPTHECFVNNSKIQLQINTLYMFITASYYISYKCYDNVSNYWVPLYESLSANIQYTPVYFYESQVWINGTINFTALSGTEIAVSNITKIELISNDVWKLSCLASDGIANSSWINSSERLINFVNNIPEIKTSNILPTPSYDNESIYGYCNASDSDIDEIFFNYRWYLNGVINRSDSTTINYEQNKEKLIANISNSSLVIGQNWVFSCQANDTLNVSNWMNSSQVTILSTVINDAPIINSSRIVPTIAYVNDTLFGYCNASDINEDDLYYNYAWYLNGALNRSGNSASSFAQSVESYITNLTSGNLSIGQNWIFSCLANDTMNVSSWINSSSVTIQNSAPIVNMTRIVPLIAHNNDTLVGYCNATDFNDDNLQYNYKWYNNSVLFISGTEFKQGTIATSSYHTCAIRANDSRVMCWGYNSNGQMGNGTTGDDVQIPQPINDSSAYLSVAVGAYHTCAIRANDSRVMCWGSNGNGRLGDGTNVDKFNPTPINDTSAYVEIATENMHTCAIRANDSRVMCWGSDGYGQLGNGVGGEQWSPGLIEDNSQYKSITAGVFHTCAVRIDDSRVMCWGDGADGQRGDDYLNDASVPGLTTDNSAYISVSAGGWHTCGIRANDSRVMCWGDNTNGEIGDNTSEIDRPIPTPINDTSDYKIINAGRMNTCGIRANDSKVLCWGDNAYGQIGDGTNLDTNISKLINDTSPYSTISVGGQHVCGIRANDSNVLCWGYNSFGNLGDDSQTPKSNPTPTYGGIEYLSKFEEGEEILISRIFNSQLTIGHNWTLSCMANDGILNSSWVNSSVVKILSTEQTAPSIPTGIYCNGQNCNSTFSGTIAISCNGSSDPEDDVITYAIEKGNVSSYITDIPGLNRRAVNFAGLAVFMNSSSSYVQALTYSATGFGATPILVQDIGQIGNYTESDYSSVSDVGIAAITDLGLDVELIIVNTTTGNLINYTQLNGNIGAATEPHAKVMFWNRSADALIAFENENIADNKFAVRRYTDGILGQQENISIDTPQSGNGKIRWFNIKQRPGTTEAAISWHNNGGANDSVGFVIWDKTNGPLFNWSTNKTGASGFVSPVYVSGATQDIAWSSDGASLFLITYNATNSSTFGNVVYFVYNRTNNNVAGPYSFNDNLTGKIDDIKACTLKDRPGQIIYIMQDNAGVGAYVIDANGTVENGWPVPDTTPERYTTPATTNIGCYMEEADNDAIVYYVDNGGLAIKTIRYNTVTKAWSSSSITGGTSSGNFASDDIEDISQTNCPVGDCFMLTTSDLLRNVSSGIFWNGSAVNISMTTRLTRSPTGTGARSAAFMFKGNWSSGTITSWSSIGNHTNGSSYTWNLASESVNETYEMLRCTATDLSGSGNWSSYYSVSSNFTIGVSLSSITVSDIPVIGSVDPYEGISRIIYVNFTASSLGGVGVINLSTINVTANLSGFYRSTSSCSNKSSSDTSVNMTCNLTMNYYDRAGVWALNISIKDTSGTSYSNSTAVFTYNELASIMIDRNSIDFGTMSIGEQDRASTPIIINNTGNANFTYLAIKSFDLVNGSYRIGAGNFTANTTNSSLGAFMINNTYVNLSLIGLAPDTDTIKSNRSVYIYADAPNIPMVAGTYRSLYSWVIAAFR